MDSALKKVRKSYTVTHESLRLTVYPEEDTDIGWSKSGKEFRLFYNGMNRLVGVQETGRQLPRCFRENG